MARKVDISELYSIFLLKSDSLLKFEYVSNEAPFFSQDVYVWAPYSAFLSTQNGPFRVMSATKIAPRVDSANSHWLKVITNSKPCVSRVTNAFHNKFS